MPEHQFTPIAVGALLALYTGQTAAQTDAIGDGIISSWLAMVTHTQDAQPHWMTPLVTVTPRLEQEFRFDAYSEDLPNHGALDSYGASNRLEFIPTENTEFAIGIPAYQTRSTNTGNTLADGWGDWPVSVLKYRILSADEGQG